MTFYVFLGPTLGFEDARRELDAEFRPPAAVGDVYRVACARPRAIGIIDGFFERTPSVWHKEILWAMSEGIHVFGAASMGALRGAELADFGMQGVGQIFSAFHSGELEDDDEVAVAHADAEQGYRPLSEAMVSIRATLAAASKAAVLTGSAQAKLEDVAKRLFYGERSYERIVRIGLEVGIPRQEVDAFRQWLPQGRIDAKREDAIAMLRVMRRLLDSEHPPMKVTYRMEHTHTWQALQRYCRASGSRTISDREEAIFDELRLRGQFMSARRAALARLLAVMQARESGKPFDKDALGETEERLRRERGLLLAEEFQAWLDENRLSASQLEEFLRDEARVAWVDQGLAHTSVAHLADLLRLTGDYAVLQQRVEEKERALSRQGAGNATLLLPPKLDEAGLWHWYFVDWLGGGNVPRDIADYATKVGFQDVPTLRRAVLREYLASTHEAHERKSERSVEAH
jgi:AraC-like DNA-binding protein